VTIQDLLQKFPGATPSGVNEWKARCPVPTHGKGHGDQHPSLQISIHNGKPTVKCWVGCAKDDVLRAVGLTTGMLDSRAKQAKPKLKNVAVYAYRDQHGHVQDEKVRTDPKGFFWRRPNAAKGRSGYRGLYKLPELLAAPADAWVFVVEGEKDVDRLTSLGLVATCSPDGAQAGDPGRKWVPAYTQTLRGRKVAIIADRDEPGQIFARYVAEQINRVAREVRLIEVLTGVTQHGGDVSDFLNGTPLFPTPDNVEALMREIEVAPLPRPEPCTLDDAYRVLHKWFGPEYDVDAFNAVMAAAASEELHGDPFWLLLISGPGGAKTETVSILSAADVATVVSTI
jgi:hypothetical protein